MHQGKRWHVCLWHQTLYKFTAQLYSLNSKFGPLGKKKKKVLLPISPVMSKETTPAQGFAKKEKEKKDVVSRTSIFFGALAVFVNCSEHTAPGV